MDESPCVVALTCEMYGDLKGRNKVIGNKVKETAVLMIAFVHMQLISIATLMIII